jgi:hypothetical protein
MPWAAYMAEYVKRLCDLNRSHSHVLENFCCWRSIRHLNAFSICWAGKTKHAVYLVSNIPAAAKPEPGDSVEEIILELGPSREEERTGACLALPYSELRCFVTPVELRTLQAASKVRIDILEVVPDKGSWYFLDSRHEGDLPSKQTLLHSPKCR